MEENNSILDSNICQGILNSDNIESYQKDEESSSKYIFINIYKYKIKSQRRIHIHLLIN